MWGSILLSKKIILGMIILKYFGGTLIFCNKDIPFCDQHLKKLKEDVKEWKQRCSSETGDEINSECCKNEKDYNQDRIKRHTKMCFYKGTIY